LAGRIANPDDPLRVMLQAARRWQVPPTVFLRLRTAGGGWSDADTTYAMALESYEAGLCPGCSHPLEETTKRDHRDAYRPDGPGVRCHYCTAQALLSEVNADKEGVEGLLFPIVLDAEVVARNKLPVPPLPPELRT
jgi:hypothetical protein